MTEVMLENGWVRYATCYCHGVYTEKYNHPEKKGWKFKIKPKKNKFIASNRNRTVKEGYNYELAAYLLTI